jgi:hypothetical protein
MKKPFLLFAFFILSFSTMQAQPDYHIAIGARFGKLNNGVTFKELFQADQNIGMEFQLYHSLEATTDGWTVKGFLFDQIPFKIPFFQLPLDFIAGGGLQIGDFPLVSGEKGYYKIVDGQPVYYGETVITVGVAANIGLEYQFKRGIPFTIGIEAVPSYDFIHPGPDWFDFGVDIRYVIR